MKAQVVYVTGASAGLGRSIGECFSSQCAIPGLIAREEEALRATSSELPARSAWALVLVGALVV